MSYQVLARKWRPQTFDDVVGQELVTRTLKNAIQADRLAHAFLFSGVRGVGKTTTARILAKALNCQQGPTSSPCRECDPCREIAEASSVDVLEIDAASNTGVDNIRELRENIRYGTARDRFKVFIIDEVHMLSNQAFNALLKTLEEPPPHVKFILATTEHHKIPVTILSRCQQFEFKPIALSLITERLELVCREEGVQISDYGLRAIAAAAEGSLRDAESALDKVVAFGGTKIDDPDIRTILGVVDDRWVLAILEAVQARDCPSLIGRLQELSNSGVEAPHLCSRLVGHVRNLMVCKVAGWDERLLNLPDTEKEAIQALAEQFSEVDLLRFYDVLSGAANQLRWHVRPFVHLEMALVKLVELARLPELEQVIGQLKAGVIERPDIPAVARVTDPQSILPAASGKSPDKKPSSPAPQVAESAPPGAGTVWQKILAHAQKVDVPLFSHLQHARGGDVKDGRYCIEFPGEDEFHLKIVVQPDNLKKLREICATILDSSLEIDVRVSGSRKQEGPDPAEDPRVKSFVETFPGKVVVEREDG